MEMEVLLRMGIGEDTKEMEVFVIDLGHNYNFKNIYLVLKL